MLWDPFNTSEDILSLLNSMLYLYTDSLYYILGKKQFEKGAYLNENKIIIQLTDKQNDLDFTIFDFNQNNATK